LNDYAEELTNDTPTIEGIRILNINIIILTFLQLILLVAIKNLMAVLLSKCLHPHDYKTNELDDDDDDNESLVFEPNVVIKCAKIVVKVINEIELSNPLEVFT